MTSLNRKKELKQDIMIVTNYINSARNNQARTALMKLKYLLKLARDR